jgi:hypothetical protein
MQRRKQVKKVKPIRPKDSSKEAAGSNSGGRPGPRIQVNVFVRECTAVALYHFLNAGAPLCLKRMIHLHLRPHSLAISAVSLWWTLTVTGTLPHLAVRITESQLRRSNVPHPVVLVIVHLFYRSVAIYYCTKKVPALEIPARLLTHTMPLDLLRTTVFSVAILVLPTLLKVNRIQFPGWLLLLLLLIPAVNDEEIDYQPITYYVIVQLLSGVVAGRWMQWSFPDDPSPKRVSVTAAL